MQPTKKRYSGCLGYAIRGILGGALVMAAANAHTQDRQETRALSAQDKVLLEMSKAFERGDSAALTRLLPRARGHVLEPWAAYFELRARLGREATEQEVEAFLQRYANTYVEDRMRADWLRLLGEQREWERFAQYYPRYRMRDERDIVCYARYVDARRTGRMAPEQVQATQRDWMAQGHFESGCGFVAQELTERGELTPLVLWRKTFAQEPALRAGAAARHAFEQALQEREEWGVAQKNWARGMRGRWLAKQHDAGALASYEQVTNMEDLSDDMLAWWARALMRTQKWATLERVIDAMSGEFRDAEATWTYWLAIAQRNQGKEREAQSLLQKIAFGVSGVHTGFYEQLAAQELGGRISLHALPRPEPLTMHEYAAARANKGLRRALLAMEIGLRTQGVREWNYETNMASVQANGAQGMGERERLAAATLACERAVLDRCISASERTRSFVDWAQRYPRPHRALFEEVAGKTAVAESLLYGLVRQESRFVVQAHSSAGARGLMQLMPATARWSAKRAGLEGFVASDVVRTDINVLLGATYLKVLLDDFEHSGADASSVALATAAYNAGPGRARAWRSNLTQTQPVRTIAWIENIPLEETRDYVKKVIANETVYRALAQGSDQNMMLTAQLSLRVAVPTTAASQQIP